jgi:nucleotide-binding universal stress UspA family protein
MTVVPDFGLGVVGSFFPDDFAERAVAEAREALAGLCEKFVGDAVPCEQVVAYGNIYEEVIETARKRGIDLIVLASHRPKLEDYLLGPNAARVVRHAGCSVLVVRQ